MRSEVEITASILREQGRSVRQVRPRSFLPAMEGCSEDLRQEGDAKDRRVGIEEE